MHHRHKLGKSARMSAVSAQFARSESRNKGSGTPTAFDAAVTIRSVRSDELVRVATELDAGLADQVQES
jgi:hypothetical protein